MDFSAVILAGGRSLRMGRDKAFMPVNGQTLLARAVELAQSLDAREILISGRMEQDYSAFGCRVLHDLEPEGGPLGGIERGLWQAGFPIVLVLAVDLARMTGSCLRRLAGRCDRLTGTVARWSGELEPLAAFYPVRCHALAAAQLRHNRRSAREFAAACLRERAIRVVRLPEKDAACFANWNTEADIVPAQARH